MSKLIERERLIPVNVNVLDPFFSTELRGSISNSISFSEIPHFHKSLEKNKTSKP
jgi:hypothetical protein